MLHAYACLIAYIIKYKHKGRWGGTIKQRKKGV